MLVELLNLLISIACILKVIRKLEPYVLRQIVGSPWTMCMTQVLLFKSKTNTCAPVISYKCVIKESECTIGCLLSFSTPLCTILGISETVSVDRGGPINMVSR